HRVGIGPSRTAEGGLLPPRPTVFDRSIPAHAEYLRRDRSGRPKSSRNRVRSVSRCRGRGSLSRSPEPRVSMKTLPRQSLRLLVLLLCGATGASAQQVVT